MIGLPSSLTALDVLAGYAPVEDAEEPLAPTRRI